MSQCAPDMRLFPVLGDQLSHDLASLRQVKVGVDHILMVEALTETSYVSHHPQKIILFLSAMRHFAEELRAKGHVVIYQDLESNPHTSLHDSIEAYAAKYRGVVMTYPGEYRVLADLETLPNLTWCEDDRFICSLADFKTWISQRKQPRMEHFYREMRRKTGLLMAGDKPVGGSWNYDGENRKKWSNSAPLAAPVAHPISETTQEVIDLVAKRFHLNFGSVDNFNWPVTRKQALVELEDFRTHRLRCFGDFQDALRTRDLHSGSDFLFHSKLSTSLNLGLLDPIEVCQAVAQSLDAGLAPINAVEGFIRQIIGWREYVHGIYWVMMPEYKKQNALNAAAPLPDAFWGGKTRMTCLAESVDQTRRSAYAHHIQRLMVTGNLALLLGVDPDALNAWYLAVYADAVEWVQLPNTHGMVAYADGGLLASKPYAASGKYIDRQGDYCRNCSYNVKNTIEPDACPMNSLYWDFIDRTAEVLSNNPRMAIPIRSWSNMNSQKKESILTKAQLIKQAFLENAV